MTDADVTLLQQYAAYVASVGTAISTIASSAASLQAAIVNTNLDDSNSAQNVVNDANSVNASAAPLYSAELTQAATELQALLAGTNSVQAQGAPSVLSDIATWLGKVDAALGPAGSLISGLQSYAATEPDWNTLNAAYGNIYAGVTLYPSGVASSLQRIAGRIQTLLASSAAGNGTQGGGGGGGGGGASAPPLPPIATSSSSTGWIIGGIAAAGAAIGALFWVKRAKKGGRRG